ncbi:hypothetical protein [endosymbiont of Lamellibrachia barhami]|uniref:hypothetical protein n=1 Tax=endosymbiont of Lamellibrachia barhami TaxID=205975 RepID=UPI0015B16814|nr:hypothetical protein [endosymbiont of Lamellibrachia barhami]
MHIHLTIGISCGERMDFYCRNRWNSALQRSNHLSERRVVGRQRLMRRMDHWQKIIVMPVNSPRRIPILHKPAGYSSK